MPRPAPSAPWRPREQRLPVPLPARLARRHDYRLIAVLAFVLAGVFALVGWAWGYPIPDGSTVRWRCPGGSGGVVATTTLHKGTNPIGAAPGGVLSRPLWDARYGRPSPTLCNGAEPVFLLYAEAADSYLQGQMRDACRRGEPAFIDQRQWDCWPGPNRGQGASIEAYDYAAVVGVAPGASGGGAGGGVPAVPAITASSSPAPGQVALTWRARASQDRFDVGCPPGQRSIPGTSAMIHSTIVELPPGAGGPIACTVTAWLGGRSGIPSRPVTVTVQPAGGSPPPPPDPPVDPPPGGECPSCPRPDCTALKAMLVQVSSEIGRVCQ